MIRIMIRLLLVLVLAAAQHPSTAAAAVDELLSADRAYSTAARDRDVVTALSAMFAEDVIAPLPGNVFADGKPKVVAALQANPDNTSGRLEWTPVRGGISADGQHGFTFGYMTLRKGDGATVPLKYLAYWVKGPDGWKVKAYKRRPRPAGEVSTEILEPSIPARLVAAESDPGRLESLRASLIAAERAFSDEAQKIGLGAAFTKYGRADAMNMGGPKDAAFVIGSASIGRSVGAGTPTDSSPVSWAADHAAAVASSGDLGVTFGFIRSNASPAAHPPIPFFTIWRRTSPSDPWRYIAE